MENMAKRNPKGESQSPAIPSLLRGQGKKAQEEHVRHQGEISFVNEYLLL